ATPGPVTLGPVTPEKPASKKTRPTRAPATILLTSRAPKQIPRQTQAKHLLSGLRLLRCPRTKPPGKTTAAADASWQNRQSKRQRKSSRPTILASTKQKTGS